ncbi:hypothetical protein NBRC116583_06970 [Arenicella sp. 4NH20-0111]|uniref:MerR family transcriptional regulator n=1 Tax=Arenicella sp. 4NH20-0111 TaxID=3127648 RepID=UPI00310B9DB8
MLISEFAKRSGVSIHTVRYYEKEGLLKSIRRNDSGRRQYQQSDLEWMVWIKRLKSTGMSLANIKKFADLRLQGDNTLQERKQMLSQHALYLKNEIGRLHSELEIVVYKVEAYTEKLDLE